MLSENWHKLLYTHHRYTRKKREKNKICMSVRACARDGDLRIKYKYTLDEEDGGSSMGPEKHEIIFVVRMLAQYRLHIFSIYRYK